MDVIKLNSILTEQSYRRKRNRQQSESPESVENPSYTAMIAESIMITPYKRATLSEIYEYMSKTFDILKKRGTGWRNCVRHTLSLNECFVKLHRPENGRSCNWTIHQAYFEAFSRGDYRKKRANRKKGKLDGETIISEHIRSRENCIERLHQNGPSVSTMWGNYSSLNGGLTKNALYTPNYMYEQLYDRSKVNTLSMTTKLDESTTYTGYNINPQAYHDLHSHTLRNMHYQDLNNDIARNSTQYSTIKPVSINMHDAKPLPVQYNVDSSNLVRPLSESSSDSRSSSYNYRTQPSYYQNVSNGRETSQYNLSSIAPTTSIAAYGAIPEKQDQSPKSNVEYSELNASLYANLSNIRSDSEQEQYDINNVRVSPAYDRPNFERYQLTPSQSMKQQCHQTPESGPESIAYNQHTTCQQHYGIDPTCYSCFPTRSYKQEFF